MANYNSNGNPELIFVRSHSFCFYSLSYIFQTFAKKRKKLAMDSK